MADNKTPSIAPLAITAGEPAGIGPDIILKIIQQTHHIPMVVIADKQLLEERAQQLKYNIQCHYWKPGDNASPLPANELYVYHTPLNAPCNPGTVDPRNAPYVLNTLEIAARGCLNKTFSAIVTAPVHKAVINEAGIPFTGHTEFFEQITNSPKVVMMLATQGLKVALATTHVPLRKVSDLITPELLTSVISILEQDLKQDFNIKNPKILVAGLNPHAGESGHMGTEDRDIIEPTLKRLVDNGSHLTGPLPADTLFTPKYLDQADAVLAMYHDQGLPVLKFKGFGQATNITLGLPIIRTSVDHGTALDLAAKGLADSGSLKTAIDYACEMVQAQSTS